MLSRRKFIRVVGGGAVVVAAASPSATKCRVPRSPAGAIPAPAKPTRAGARQIVISHGTFVELLVLAAAAEGYSAAVTPFLRGPFADTPDDRPVARIDFHRDPAIAVDPLAAQIPHRRSNKEPYDPNRTLEPAHERALLAAFDEAGLAMTLEMATARTHLESIDRTRIGATEIARHRDGIDLHRPVFWWGQQLGFYTREKAREPGTFAYQAGLDYTKSWTESVVAFGGITSADNQRATQLATGRAYVRVNLQASATGVAMHPLSQVLQEYLEMTELQRDFLDETKTRPSETVKMFFRLGYATPPPPAPRRDLNDLVRA